jgi:hypothetical protein
MWANTKNIQIIHRRTGEMITWSLPPWNSADVPMVLDEADHREFIGTREQSRLTCLDMDSGKVVASLPTAGDMDDMFYDSGRKHIYVAGGEGFLSVMQQVDPDQCTDLGKFATALHTRTGVWHEQRVRLYVAAPATGVPVARLLGIRSPN